MKALSFIVVFFIAFLNLSVLKAHSQGNSVETFTVQPGPTVFLAHDLWNNLGQSAFVGGQFDQFLRGNSYGRSWFDWSLVPDSVSLPCGICCYNPDTFTVDYSITGEFGTGWNYKILRHETGHAMGGVGEGTAYDFSVNPPRLVDTYGDNYDPQGTGGGHWNALYKETMGFIGPFGLRPLTYVTNSGEYYITDIESQSEGSKAIKILRTEFILYRSDMQVYRAIREFFYLELRTNHYFMSTKKGRKGGGSFHAPAVQVRVGTPPYIGGPITYHPTSKLAINYGNRGGLVSGTGFAARQDLQSQVTYFGTTNHVYRNFSVRVISADSLGARVSVQFQ